MSVRGYKVFNPDWTCRGFRYEVGKTFEHDGDIKICGVWFSLLQEGKQEETFYICIVDRETKMIEEFEVSDYEWRNVARGDYVRVSHSKRSRVGKSVEVLG